MSDIIMTTIITGMRNFIEKHIGGTLLSCRLDCAIKMKLRVVAIKVSRCQHGKKMKRPWLYSLEEFQGILPRFFPCRAIVGES